MLAYTYSRYGGPEVVELTELPTPTPSATEVLVKIYATTVSAADWRLRSLTLPQGMGWLGRLMFGITKPRKPVLGTEFSGVVEDVGADVTEFKPGDAVIGFPGASLGAHAQFITMPADGKLVHKPAQLGFETAAAIAFGATTAYDYLVTKGNLQPGEKLLINGASGATGSACVQLAKHLGAEVTAVASARNDALLRSLGADHVIDYQTEDFEKNGVAYDVVVDTNGSAPWSRTRHALRPGGRMLLIAGKTSDMLFGALKARLEGKRLISGVAAESRGLLETVVILTAEGAMDPVIDRCFAFDEMRAAHALVETGHKRGNVVVRVQPDLIAATGP